MPVYGYLLELREMLSAVNLMPWIGRLNWFGRGAITILMITLDGSG